MNGHGSLDGIAPRREAFSLEEAPCGSTGLLHLPQTLMTEGWHLLLLQTLAGASVGGILPSISALLATYGQHGEEGAVYGLDNAIGAAARAAAPMAGVCVAMLFNLRASFLATGLLFLLAGILAMAYLPASGRTLPRRTV